MSSQSINKLSYRTGDMVSHERRLEIQKKYRETHREELRQKSREYCIKNRDKELEKARKYRQQNKDKIKQYYNDNAEKIRQRARDWRYNNSERVKQRDQEYYITHRDDIIPKLTVSTRKWRRDNPEKYKVHKQIINYNNIRVGRCSICGLEGKTHIHHIKYNIGNPLKDTIELCPSCHRKQHSYKKKNGGGE